MFLCMSIFCGKIPRKNRANCHLFFFYLHTPYWQVVHSQAIICANKNNKIINPPPPPNSVSFILNKMCVCVCKCVCSCFCSISLQKKKPNQNSSESWSSDLTFSFLTSYF